MLVGRVVSLFRYPVKSMPGEALTQAQVGWQGLAGDRRWAFIRPGLERSNFPWLTLREQPGLARYQPRLVDPNQPETCQTLVRTPTGRELDVADPALCAELGEGVRMIRQNRGAFDWLPLSLVTTQTLAGLSALVGETLEPVRFRPNLVIEATTGAAFPEDEWVGHALRVGALRMRVDQRDSRCVMVNLNPVTGAQNPAVLRAIAQQRAACLGVYGSVVQPALVAVGDAVMLEA
jgi:uncharacterized protein